jgi:hypothetical protein
MRHFGHNPAGAFAASGEPHCGQLLDDFVFTPVTDRLAESCYTMQESGI